MIKLRYGNTNTFFINGLLIDTDYAGTLPALYKELKNRGIAMEDIRYVMATHYHPDHMGIMGELVKQGVKLLLVDVQKESVHSSDYIFARDKIPFVPLDANQAIVITCEESRSFFAGLEIEGEIISTPSHSKDSVTIVFDDGDCVIGDIEPYEYIEAYEENSRLQSDWEQILSFRPKTIYYAHRPERKTANEK